MASTPRLAMESIPGRRPYQEDAVLTKTLDDGRILVAVADGMGGHAAGDVASALAMEALVEAVEEGQGLADAFTLANSRVHTKSMEPGKQGMGTTLVAAVIDGDEYRVANVGDSRAYLLTNDGIRQISEDHSFVAEAVKRGQDEEEAMNSRFKDALTRSIGIDDEVKVDEFGPFPVENDTALLLCSDGLYKVMKADRVRSLYGQSGGPRGAAQNMVATAFEDAATAEPSLSSEDTSGDSQKAVGVIPVLGSEPGSDAAKEAPGDNDTAQLQIENVALHYPILRGLLRRQVGTVRAVDGVDLTIRRGETLGLVGESGCGKTSVGRLVARLVEPTAGRIRFGADGGLEEITHISQKEMKRVRRAMGMVFQDPLSSLNARMNIRNIVGEPLMLHQVAKGRAVDDRVGELLEMVGLRAAHQSRFPHAFSGGQRQRIAIARALATEPSFLVADEPVSALDVSVQAQILNLLLTLQQQLSLSMLFIAHDIAVVRHVSDRIAVMYLGKIVELGEAREICVRPVHPYTEALLASIPLPMPGLETLREMPKGDLPDPANPPTGCRFHTRCPYRQPICEQEEPPLRQIAGNADHFGACHFQDELHLEGVEEIEEIHAPAAAAVGK